MTKKKLKPTGKKYFKLTDPIFHQRVHVFINYSREDYEAWLKKRGVVDESHWNNQLMAFSTEMKSATAPTEWIIYVPNFDWKIQDHGSVVHEVVHTIMKIWASNNVPFSLDTQEFVATSVHRLYEDITAKIFNSTL